MRLHKYRARNFRFSTTRERWVVHTIQKNDTLYRLATKYNVPLLTIFRNNPALDPRQLVVGDKIRITRCS
ncbi:MAG: LysM peptidoglycan-binding domain-containing protein [Firmicutes bacterium]|nr:LysM peptidoglycan-binding domain-containing protein [Bacillota bacterium]